MQELMIGELARKTEVNVETVRYYERRGLLPAPTRGPGGYRQYSDGDVARVRAIRQLQKLGFTLREILEVLPILSRRRPSCAALARHAERKIGQLARKIHELEQAKSALEQLIDRCTWKPRSKQRCELATEVTIVTD